MSEPQKEISPHGESTKWFVITVIGVLLYLIASFGFVTTKDVEPTDDQIRKTPSEEAHD